MSAAADLEGAGAQLQALLDVLVQRQADGDPLLLGERGDGERPGHNLLAHWETPGRERALANQYSATFSLFSLEMLVA